MKILDTWNVPLKWWGFERVQHGINVSSVSAHTLDLALTVVLLSLVKVAAEIKLRFWLSDGSNSDVPVQNGFHLFDDGVELWNGWQPKFVTYLYRLALHALVGLFSTLWGHHLGSPKGESRIVFLIILIFLSEITGGLVGLPYDVDLCLSFGEWLSDGVTYGC